VTFVTGVVVALWIGGAGGAGAQEDTVSTGNTVSTGSNTASDPGGVSGLRLAIVGSTVVASMTAIHIYQENGWWKDNKAPFHFREDLDYGRGVDKIGHFYGASVMTFILSKSFRWANVPEDDALLLGAGTSLLFQTYIEVRDGYSKWGFDRVDFAANVGGAFYPLLQYYSPLLRKLNLKFSYHPSDLLNNPGGVGFRGQEHILFDDYEGQTFWLSFTMNEILPGSVNEFWPDWLCLALGYGARNVAAPDSYSILLVGLDYDLTRIIPQTSGFLRVLSQTLNFIRLPAPTIQISPTAIWYGFYF
jgi:hypothetical protein